MEGSSFPRRRVGFLTLVVEKRVSDRFNELSLLTFFQDFVELLKELSLTFQRNELLACEIPRLIDEKIMNLEMLSVVSGVNRLKEKLSGNTSNEIIYDSDIILDIPAGKRGLIEHNIDSYVTSYTCIL